ncbi:flavodoxin family protein [Candidatus Borrarchaeum sp.]|uniref:flavodoxin family protein n=1 Tax=Candidatus Borrarchaeum sp. TaxID=2846742 RepID=UPI00257F3A4F|nr:flavodoxin family protein [Candidatus Borrarchaeum sp.]
MQILAISGSPRKEGNTEYLVDVFLKTAEKLGANVDLIRLSEFKIHPCDSCWICVENGKCAIKDEMEEIYPKLLASDGILIASPVYFNNVTAQTKIFIDRTWCMRRKLKGKVGGCVVVGRRFGHETAIQAIHSFFLKHEITVSYRGVVGFAFSKGEITSDIHAIKSARYLAKSMIMMIKRLQHRK